jgi:hypothetical protein
MLAAAALAYPNPNPNPDPNPIPRLQLIVCGQALSHCVNYTLRDLLDPSVGNIPGSKVYLLEDGKCVCLCVLGVGGANC